jgi:hypothetical protein
LGLDNFSRVELVATYQMKIEACINETFTSCYINMCKNMLKTTAKTVRQALLG